MNEGNTPKDSPKTTLTTEEIQQLRTALYHLSTDVIGEEITTLGKDAMHQVLILLRPIVNLPENLELPNIQPPPSECPEK